jgi:lambda repressor-like predicted transcriptional regulator
MTKLTKFTTQQILSDLADGYTMVDACKKAGVSRQALYKRMKGNNELDVSVRIAQQYSAEKALEELDKLYDDALHKRKDYDPHVLRDYAHHVRWKVQKIIPERYGEQKNKAGVEVTDGGIRIMWES